MRSSVGGLSLGVFAVLLGFVGSSAWSAETGDALHRCAALDGDSERLACYDQLAGRGSRPPRVAARPENDVAASSDRFYRGADTSLSVSLGAPPVGNHPIGGSVLLAKGRLHGCCGA